MNDPPPQKKMHQFEQVNMQTTQNSTKMVQMRPIWPLCCLVLGSLV